MMPSTMWRGLPIAAPSSASSIVDPGRTESATSSAQLAGNGSSSQRGNS
jgi:hypothetical protein